MAHFSEKKYGGRKVYLGAVYITGEHSANNFRRNMADVKESISFFILTSIGKTVVCSSQSGDEAHNCWHPAVAVQGLIKYPKSSYLRSKYKIFLISDQQCILPTQNLANAVKSNLVRSVSHPLSLAPPKILNHEIIVAPYEWHGVSNHMTTYSNENIFPR